MRERCEAPASLRDFASFRSCGSLVSFSASDFENKVVEKGEVQSHLEYAIATGYLEGSAGNPESGEDAPLAVCKNARITNEGEQVLRTKFFKV